MPLTPEDVAHVAMLARLGLDDAERAHLGGQLGAILEAVDRLREVDTSAVDETAQVGGLVNVWRDDEPGPSLDVEAALRNAPDRDGDWLRVGAIQE